MKRRIVLLLSVLLLGIGSCRKSPIDPKVVAFLGSEIVFSESGKENFDEKIGSYDYLLVYSLSPDDCTPCFLQSIGVLDFHRNDLERFGVKVLLMIPEVSRVEAEEFMEQVGVDYPVLYEKDDEFRKANGLMNNPMCKTFVMDGNNKVIWIGSPVQNDKSWKRYCKMMEMLRKDK